MEENFDEILDEDFIEECDEDLESFDELNKSKKRARRRELTSHKNKRNIRVCQYGYNPLTGFYKESEFGDKYYSPCSRARTAAFLKKQSRRKVRHTNKMTGNHGSYKKVYDLWWNLT